VSGIAGALKNQWRVSVWIEGIGEIGAFDQSTGGVGESAEKKYREGGARDQTVLAAARMRSNVSVERLWRGERDGASYKRIDNARGKEMIVTKQPLDADYNDLGEAIIYKGTVKNVTGPDTDSNDDDGEAKLAIEQSTSNKLG
jgi:hypothetical protein